MGILQSLVNKLIYGLNLIEMSESKERNNQVEYLIVLVNCLYKNKDEGDIKSRDDKNNYSFYI